MTDTYTCEQCGATYVAQDDGSIIHVPKSVERELLDALRKLANEVEAVTGAYPLADYIGNTNLAVLTLRAQEARAALALPVAQRVIQWQQYTGRTQ